MSKGAAQRLLKGMMASGFGQIVSVVVTLVSMPVFIHLLGPSGFADWTLLGSIPATLALNDLGFGMAATAEMTQRVAREDRQGALRVFQSCWLLVSAVSAAAFLLLFPFALWGPWVQWVNLAQLDASSARICGALMILLMLGQQQLSLIAAAYKSDGLYARVTVIENWQRLLQYVVGFTCCFFAGTVTSFVAGFVITYLAFVVFMAVDLRRQRPWITWGRSHASWEEVKPLVKPALSFAAYPFGIALNLQAMIWVINLSLGPVQGYWSAMRTLSRAVIQVAQIFIGPAPVEISAALGRDDRLLAQRIHHSVLQAGLLASAVACSGLALFGRPIFELFTKGKYEYGIGLFLLFLGVALLNSAWNVSMSVAYAVNRHMALTIAYLAANGAAFIIGVLMAKSAGLEGLAFALLAVDALMVVIVLRKALTILQETPGGLLRALVQNPLTLLKRLKSETKG